MKAKMILMLSALGLLPGCDLETPQAFITVIGDKSQTGALIRSEAARTELVDTIMTATEPDQGFMTGDTVEIHAGGNRSVANALDTKTIETHARRRLATIRPLVTQEVDALFALEDPLAGDTETHLVAALEAAAPDCTRDGLVIIYSDGIEESEPDFLETLERGEPIDLPAPRAPYLRSCRVHWMALGETALNPFTGTDRRLSTAQHAALEAAWRRYLIAAGVAETDIQFI